MKTIFISIAMLVSAAIISPSYGADHDMAGMDMGQAKESQAAPNNLSQGEIRKVDKSGKRLTIKHGPLENLNMPGMTMVFKVKDPAMMDQVKAGDKVNFVADQVNGVLTVTKIEKAN